MPGILTTGEPPFTSCFGGLQKLTRHRLTLTFQEITPKIIKENR